MEWSDTGIVLRIGSFRESDLWVRLLTPKHGIVSAFAFGGCKSKRRFCGCLGLLNELKVRAQTSRNGRFLSLQEALFIKGPVRLRTNRDNFGVIVNCIRFLEAIGVNSDSAVLSYALIGALLRELEERIERADIIPILFRLRAITDQGYAPKFSFCSSCESPLVEKVFFKVSEGRVLCKRCVGDVRNVLRADKETLKLLQSAQSDDPSDWKLSEARDVSLRQRRESVEIVNAFVQYHLGVFWSDGRFHRR